MPPGPPPPRRRRDVLLVLTAAGVATFLATLLALGTTPGADTVVWAPAARNGLQAGDLPIAGVWLLAAGSCVVMLTRRRSAPRIAAITAAVALSVLAATLLKGDGPDSGRTLVALGAGMGVNVGDLPVLAAWLIGLCAVAVAARRPVGATR